MCTISFHLSSKNLLKSIVVSDGSQACVGSAEGYSRRSRAFHEEPSNELACDVLGVGSGTAVPSQEDGLSLDNGLAKNFGGLVYVVGKAT
jgi:hypothetical protein